MTNVIDWILDLFRDPVQAQAFVNDPERTMQQAGVQGVTAAQVQAVAATVAPAAVIQGGGNPLHGLQQAVAETHGIAFAPEHVFAPETQAFSNNDTLSHNDTRLLSPEAGHDVQQGGVNLGFGDITFGDKTTNTATGGGVVNTGNAGDILTDGSVKQTGAHNTANTGDIHAGSGSPVVVGEGNEVHNTNQQAGGDIIGHDSNVIKDVNTSGGEGGNAHAGGGILGGGSASGGGGGGGGAVTINNNHNTTTDTHGGDITSVNTGGGDIHGGVDASHHDDNSVHVDNSTHDSHNDNSVHTDNSVHQTVDTNVDTGIHLGF
jgi:hypothetical protein